MLYGCSFTQFISDFSASDFSTCGVLGVVVAAVVRQPVGDLVAGVVLQHVQDEALLDGLLHGVQVERLRQPVRALAAEQLQGLGLRGGGESEVADVLRIGAFGHFGGQIGFDVELAAVVDVRQFVRGEDLLQLVGGGAGLRGVRLVGDDGEVPALQSLGFGDGLQREREGLDGDDDDRCPGHQRGGEFGGLGAGVAADGDHDAGLVLDLVDRILQLGIQHRPVRHDDDGVEDLLVAGTVQGAELVRGPGDRVGLAGPGGVLHEVAVAGAFGAGGLDELVDDVPLVVAGEQQGLADFPFAGDGVGRVADLQVQELADDVQPGVTLQDLLPQVAGGRALGVDRVPGMAVVAEVEGQEVGVLALELGGHLDFVVADGEVHQGAAAEGQQRLVLVLGVPGQPVLAVLLDGVIDVLREVGLEFDGRDRQAVDEQDQVDALQGVDRGVVHLPDHPEADLAVALQRLRVQAHGRLELAHVELSGDILEPGAQDREHAGFLGRRLVQDLAEPVQEQPLRDLVLGGGVRRFQDLGQLLRLRVREPREDVLRDEGPGGVVELAGFPVRFVDPALGRQGLADLVLECHFIVLRHTVPPRNCRRSPDRASSRSRSVHLNPHAVLEHQRRQTVTVDENQRVVRGVSGDGTRSRL